MGGSRSAALPHGARAARARAPPWWAPPETPDAARRHRPRHRCAPSPSCSATSARCSRQTITFAADEFDATKTDQGATLAAVRIGVLGALVLTALADRRGAGGSCSACAAVGCVVAALSGLAPDLVALGVAQTVVRGLATAGGVLVVVVAAEEMPPGSRAFAITLLGGRRRARRRPVPDGAAARRPRRRRLAARDARVPSCCCPLVRLAARHLPESRRFVAAHADVPHGRPRVAGSGCSRRPALLLPLFTAPASQLLNEFLRDERGLLGAADHRCSASSPTPPAASGWWSAAGWPTPAGAGGSGAVRGGRRHAPHRRRWSCSADGRCGCLSIVGRDRAAPWSCPALGVYGPELFPTSLRGRANGDHRHPRASPAACSGSLVGGPAPDRWDGLGPALAVLAIGPLLMAVLVLVAYPETAHRELEELNPEDQLDAPPGAVPSSPSAPPVHCQPCLFAPARFAAPCRTSWSARCCSSAPAPGERPELGDERTPPRTTEAETTTTSTTVPEPTGAEIAQAREPSIDVYASEDATEPERQIVSGVDTSVDTIPIVFLVKTPGETRLEVYLPVRPNGSHGWVNVVGRHPQPRAVPHRGGHLRASDPRLQDEEIIVDEPVGVGAPGPAPPGPS